MPRPRKPQSPPQPLTIEMTAGALESALQASLQPLYAEIAELKSQLAASISAQRISQQALTELIAQVKQLDINQTQQFKQFLDSLQQQLTSDADAGT
ncbi:MAG: hypothetical protein AAGC54_16175 [Cyanobacteria bacterium P01_F01_bin.4]